MHRTRRSVPVNCNGKVYVCTYLYQPNNYRYIFTTDNLLWLGTKFTSVCSRFLLLLGFQLSFGNFRGKIIYSVDHSRTKFPDDLDELILRTFSRRIVIPSVKSDDLEHDLCMNEISTTFH